MRRHVLAATLVLVATGLLPLLEETEAGPPDELTVQVVAADTGKPVRGAEVRAEAATPRGITRWTEKTDQRGMATLQAVEVKRLVLRVSAEGFVGVERDPVVMADAEQPLRISLATGLAFDGIVLDESGGPVSRARVEVRAGGVFKDEQEAKPNGVRFLDSSTDKDGKFHVPGIPGDCIATVIVRARGFAQGRVAVRAEKGRVAPQPLEIRLAPGGRVRGRVLDPDGEAVAGATVYVIADGIPALKSDPRSAAPGSAASHTYLDRHTTDRKGRFAIDGLSLGRSYLARAYGEGFDCSEWVGPFSVAKKGEKATIALTLRSEDSGGGTPKEDGAASSLAIAKLLATIDDEDVDGRLRMQAAQSLGKIRAGGIEALASLLKRDNPATRMYALVGIGDAGPDAKQAVPALVAALRDKHKEIRALAIGALGQIGPAAREAIPALQALATQGSENAKRALEKIRSP